MRFLVFDCESVGLHGETFAVGLVVVEWKAGVGRVISGDRYVCSLASARGTVDGREWVGKKVPRMIEDCTSPRDVRDNFWEIWQVHRGENTHLAADVPWPVEARFLMECVADDPDAREWQGPYPLLDIASIRLAAGLDPIATVERLPDELPEHDPLCDARQSARLLIEALARLHVGAPGLIEPYRDNAGQPVTLMGLPVVVNPDTKPGPTPVFGPPLVEG